MSNLENLNGKQEPIDTKLGMLGMEIENMQRHLGVFTALIKEQRDLLARAKLENPDNHTYINDLASQIVANELEYKSEAKEYAAALKLYGDRKSHLQKKSS